MQINLSELRDGQLVQFYLMGGYLYEYGIRGIMDDNTWDQLCLLLKARWDAINHPHKKYIEYDSLSSATACYLSKDALPKMVIGAAEEATLNGVYVNGDYQYE